MYEFYIGLSPSCTTCAFRLQGIFRRPAKRATRVSEFFSFQDQSEIIEFSGIDLG